MINRRTLLLSSLGFAAAGLAAPARAETRRLVVMTSYPQEVISRYVDAFQAANPNTRVDIVWHSGDDARDYLLGDGRGKVDVYWSPSVRTFFELARKGAFRKLSVDRTQLPGRIGKQAISDPDGFYEASEIAGYGFVVNPAYLQQHGLRQPTEWADLADPVFAGHVTMPVPSRIGFAPTITEIILQSAGWQAGWALLAAIGANAKLQAGRGDDAMGDVQRGDKGLAVTIDFFAAQAIARGAKLTFVYPTANAFEPANIAISTDAPNPEGAQSYLDFVLSEAGQRLLIDPDLRRLAIRPSVYNGAPPGYFNPFVIASDALSFDNRVFVERRDLDNAVFDRLIYEPRDRTAPLWATLHRLEADIARPPEARARIAPLLVQARGLLTAVPISESDANAIAGAFAGRRRDGGETTPAAREAEAAWSQTVAQNIAKAGADLAQADGITG